MNRLTNWKDGNAFFPKCFEEPCGGGGCTRDDCEFLYRACEKLARYEDSGLEPEDLKRAFNEDTILKLAAQVLGTTPERLKELAQAGRDKLAEKKGRTLWNG